MKLTLIEQSEGQVTLVNPEQITYMREDVYGTAIHFSSGEHVICPQDIEALLLRFQAVSPETLLIQSPA